MDFDNQFFSYINEIYNNDLQVPMYQLYGQGGPYEEEMAYERDYRKLQELFPREARGISQQIREQCDQLEYRGSAMFDEYPDRFTIEAICRRIYRNLHPQEELTGMSFGNNPLLQLIQVMLLNEMHFRRCRNHRCQRRYW